MTATAHAVIGVAIAATITNPVLAIPLAFASHILADSIPHWDTGTHRREKGKKKYFMHSFYDGLLGIAATIFMAQFVFPETSLLYAFVIVFFSELLDFLQAPYLFFDLKSPFIYFYKFQKLFDHKLDKPWGIITQILAVSIIVVLAKIL